MDITILRLPQVIARTGLSKSSIYAKVAAGEFPEPISLGARAVGWISDEVQAYLVIRVEVSRQSGLERDADAEDDDHADED